MPYPSNGEPGVFLDFELLYPDHGLYPDEDLFGSTGEYEEYGISFESLYPEARLYPGLEENEDQDYPNLVAPYGESPTRRYYPYARRRIR